jgi:plasmid maintenance system antidote protein VapI
MSATTRTHYTHHGIILREEFFESNDIAQAAAAKATGIPQSRIRQIFADNRFTTADTHNQHCST